MKTVQRMLLKVSQKWRQRSKGWNKLIFWLHIVLTSKNNNFKALYKCARNYNIRTLYLIYQAFGRRLHKMIFWTLVNFVTKTQISSLKTFIYGYLIFNANDTSDILKASRRYIPDSHRFTGIPSLPVACDCLPFY